MEADSKETICDDCKALLYRSRPDIKFKIGKMEMIPMEYGQGFHLTQEGMFCGACYYKRQERKGNTCESLTKGSEKE